MKICVYLLVHVVFRGCSHTTCTPARYGNPNWSIYRIKNTSSKSQNFWLFCTLIMGDRSRGKRSKRENAIDLRCGCLISNRNGPQKCNCRWALLLGGREYRSTQWGCGWDSLCRRNETSKTPTQGNFPPPPPLGVATRVEPPGPSLKSKCDYNSPPVYRTENPNSNSTIWSNSANRSWKF